MFIYKTILAYIKVIVNDIYNKNTHKSAFFYTGVTEKWRDLSMNTNLILNTKLNKNNIIINIEYDVCVDSHFKANSYMDKLIISFAPGSYNFVLNHMDESDIKERLLNFGCTQEEIQKFINLAKFDTVDTDYIKFRIYDYEYIDAQIVLDEIFAGKDSKLTNIQKKLLRNELKHEITYNEYIKLPKNEQSIYEKYSYDYMCINNNLKFINEFITKHQDDIEFISVTAKLNTNSCNPYSRLEIQTTPIAPINASNQKIKDFYLIEFNKYYQEKGMSLISTHNVPLIELHPEFEDAFTDFNETKFTSGLIPDIFKEFNDNIITTYKFKQTEEFIEKIKDLQKAATEAIINDNPNPLSKNEIQLINSPIYITLNTDKAPDGYKLSSIVSKTLKPEYYNKLNNTKDKIVNTSDILYLLNYINCHIM